MELKTISKICLLFFIYILVAYFYLGIISRPHEGDSLNYHIPIAKAYLNGDVFFPEKIKGVPFLKYSPGASEGVLSLFYALHVPPNLYNVLGVVFFFFTLFFLGKRFGLSKEMGMLFAISIVTLNGIVRWLDTQIIDIYLASFFVLSLALLQKPEKKVSYFVKLGVTLGMLVGSKYSGMLFGVILMLIFSRRILPFLSIKRVMGFVAPFSLFGASWYLRNYLSTGNPLYPQGFLFFKDAGFDILKLQVIRVVTSSWFGFFGTMNAFISEYMIWGLSVPIIIVYVISSAVKKIKMNPGILLLLIIGILNFLIYAFLPSDNKDYIMVSVIRYSYPAVVPFILAVFLLAKEYKKETHLGIVVFSNMIWSGFPMFYNPKLIFIFVPIALFIFSKINVFSNTNRR